MPTYDYRCKKCGYSFEVFQSMLSEPIKDCPRCKTGRVERLITAGAGIIFKGSGFYETDYKRNVSGNGNGKKAATSVSNYASSKKETAKLESHKD